jgi:hypothetical protein
MAARMNYSGRSDHARRVSASAVVAARARLEPTTNSGLPDRHEEPATSAAYDAMHHLCVELHYLSCSGGVGKGRRR